MSITIHFGVVDIPYSWTVGVGKNKTTHSRNETTGDVAEILEAKYHVMEHFYELHQEDIMAALHESIEVALETALMGGPRIGNPAAAAAQEIEQMFMRFLSNRELDSLGYPGIPTLAAQRGVSHRFKHPYARRPPRPSFIDTGLLESSMRVWSD